MQAIDAYLQGPPPGYALLIAGPWGVGKSFFWSAKAQTLTDLTAITFSAAGLNTQADLERALFQASIKGFGDNVAIEAGTVLGRALLRFVNIDPNDIKLKAEATGGKTVVCIDDVERFAGKFAVLFGFIVNLIDDNGVHCILIADEARALSDLNGYDVSKERIVGKTVRIAPDLRQFCDQVIKGFGSVQSRTVMDAALDKLLDLIERSGIRNLRTIRFLLTELDDIVRNLPADHANAVAGSSLLSALAFSLFAISRKAGNATLVARAFTQGDLGMAFAMHEHNAGQQQEDDNGISKLAELLTEFGLYNESYGWPQSPALIEIISSGNCDYEQLASDFGLSTRAQEGPDADPLAVLKQFYKHTDDEVRAALSAASDILFSTPADIGRVFDIYDSLYFFSHRGIFEPTPDAWTNRVVEFVQQLEAKPENIASSSFEPWVESPDDNRRRVIAVCQSAAAAHESADKRRRVEAGLRALITGEGEAPGATDYEVFESVTDIQALFGQIRESGMGAVVRFRRFFASRMRIQNSADFIGGDRDVSLQLAEHIAASVQESRPMPLLDSELKALGETLQSFVDFVDRWRSK